MDLIVIPSSGRHDRMQTLATFQRTGITHSFETVVVVPWQERKKYDFMKYKGKRVKGAEVIGVPTKYAGIARTREWVLTKLSVGYGVRKIFMIDDDLSFCHRPKIDLPDMPYINNDGEALTKMIMTLSKWHDKGIIHCGLISRQANRKTGTPWQEPGRMMNAYSYDAEALRELPIEYGRVPVMEDFDLTLQLIRLGYPSRVSCRYAWTQTSNMAGGCSAYRTAEVQADAAYKLAKLHPKFVTVVKKEAKTWKGGLTERVDVRVAWKKAYESSKFNIGKAKAAQTRRMLNV